MWPRWVPVWAWPFIDLSLDLFLCGVLSFADARWAQFTAGLLIAAGWLGSHYYWVPVWREEIERWAAERRRD